MTLFRTLSAYVLVIGVSFLPLVISNFDPLKSYIADLQSILLFSISFKSIMYAISIVFLIIALKSTFEIFGSNYKYTPMLLISIFIAILVIVYGGNINGSLKFFFLPNLIPSLISAAIGIIGTFTISCFIRPFCENEPKFQRQNILLPLRNTN